MKETEHRRTFLRLRMRPWGLLTAAGFVACAATIFGFFGRFFWLLDLFSHFRVQYFVGLGVLAPLLLIPKRRKTALIFAAFAVINLGTILPLFFGRAGSHQGSGRTLRAILLNVNTKSGDVDLVADVLRDFDPDIVVFEEINVQWVRDLRSVMQAWPYSRILPREDNFGIGLFSKLPLTGDRIVYIGDAEVPSIVAEVRTGDAAVTIIATHPLPPAGADYSRRRNDHLDDLPRYIRRARSPVLLLGDLNTTPWSYHFKRLLQRSGLKDSSRGRGVQPTWPTFNPLLRIPIDHCLHSDEITIVRKEVGPFVGSDHYPLIVDFIVQGENGPTSRRSRTAPVGSRPAGDEGRMP